MITPQCNACGKFRKKDDVVLLEDSTFDGLCVEQWIECRFCCSDDDYERYFEKKFGVRND